MDLTPDMTNSRGVPQDWRYSGQIFDRSSAGGRGQVQDLDWSDEVCNESDMLYFHHEKT
jgi:hypothetical protein